MDKFREDIPRYVLQYALATASSVFAFLWLTPTVKNYFPSVDEKVVFVLATFIIYSITLFAIGLIFMTPYVRSFFDKRHIFAGMYLSCTPNENFVGIMHIKFEFF